jgi:hypothetical protein
MADTTNVGAAEVQTEGKKVEIEFPVYMIYSKWSLANMDRFIGQYGGVGFLRIVFGKDDKETDRTIAVLSKETFDVLTKDGYGDTKPDERAYGRGFRVTPFKLNDNSFPGEGRNITLFVPVPKTLGGDDTWVFDRVTEKLKHLAEWGIIDEGSWSVNIPLKSREEGGVRGGCFISFKRDYALERIAMTRILLTDTYWPASEGQGQEQEKRSIFHCYWAREREQREQDEGETKEGAPAKKVWKTKEERLAVEKERRKTSIQKTARYAQPGPSKKAVPAVVQPVLKETEEEETKA